MAEKSDSQSLEEHITTQFENRYDYTSKYNIQNDRKAITEYLGLKKKQGYDLYGKIFKKVLKKKKLKVSDYIDTRFRRPKNSEIKATITPKPQGPFEPEKDPVDKIKDQIIQEQSEVNEAQIQKLGSLPEVEIKKEWSNIEPEAVEGALRGLWELLKLYFPMLEELTPEERQEIVKMWLPGFRRYLPEFWAYIGIPLVATITIFAKHIKEAREIKKSKKEQNKKEKLEEKPGKKPDKFTSKSGLVYNEEKQAWEKKIRHY